MTAHTYQPNDKANFTGLMTEGRAAFKRGETRKAHDLWRQAAMLDPYNEQVWLALLDVLDTPEDRRVCLQNILSINPLNVQARRMLRADEAQMQRQAHQREKAKRRAAAHRQQRWVLVRRAVTIGVLLGLTGLVFAVVLSILLYA